MSLGHLCLLVAGIALLLATWGSLLATFVLPRGGSVFSLPSHALIWGVHHALAFVARALPRFDQKDALLALAGPLALLAQLAAFLASFLVALACCFTPWVDSFAGALPVAAASLFSVGLAHVVGPSNNVLVVIAAATGAITVALQIGYLPAIYQSFARREALVTLTESRAGLPAWGPEVLIRHQLVTSLDALGPLYSEFERWSAELAESHSTYPPLLVFRSPEPGYSWLLSLLAILDAAAMQLALFPRSAPSEARMCLRMGFSALRRIARTMHVNFDPDPDPAGPIDLSEQAFAAAADQLVAAGLVPERDVGDAWPHFVGWRVNYEAIAYTLADRLVAPHVPWSGPRHHLPADLMLPKRPPHRSPGGVELPEGRYREGA